MGNQGPERLSNTPKVTQLVGGGAGIETQAGLELSHRNPVPTSSFPHTPSSGQLQWLLQDLEGRPFVKWFSRKLGILRLLPPGGEGGVNNP